MSGGICFIVVFYYIFLPDTDVTTTSLWYCMCCVSPVCHLWR